MEKEAAITTFIFVASTIILLGYLIQCVLAFFKSLGEQDDPRPTLLVETFSLRSFEQTWLIVAFIFIGPLLISWISKFDELLGASSDLKIVSILVLSMLLIFITLELGLLASLNRNNRNWLKLLAFAAVLDTGGVVVVTIIKNSNLDPVYIYLVIGYGALALVSSFLIILFTHVAGLDDG